MFEFVKQKGARQKGEEFGFDHRIVVVSSMNWLGEGILSNRRARVIIEDAAAAAYYEKIFTDDWNTHAAQKDGQPRKCETRQACLGQWIAAISSI